MLLERAYVRDLTVNRQKGRNTFAANCITKVQNNAASYFGLSSLQTTPSSAIKKKDKNYTQTSVTGLMFINNLKMSKKVVCFAQILIVILILKEFYGYHILFSPTL